ncbi:glycosyltransferase family 61 protein [Nocardioides sp. zg-DK7169]|uniref:glycosyltransferase family 61 protein n=1 Tax=Nocardioides sp. zg-DK7169 TaxID=2736600 RepID=UPI001556710F|nr:glycosyltransferase family 61 protein [Nocardioides sp. zg-DK7169]NPC98940.1 glycosyltransferase family 61 protein [Nocardioides sp. zg-DK7169]
MSGSSRPEDGQPGAADPVDGPGAEALDGDPLIDPIAHLLPAGERRGTVVVTDAQRRERAEQWRVRLAPSDRTGVRVLEAEPDTTEEDLRTALVAGGSDDVMVVVLAPSSVVRIFGSHRQLVRQIFAHVRPHGAFLVDVSDDRAEHGREARLERMLRAVREAMDDTTPLDEEAGTLDVARAARELHDLGDVVVILKRGKHAYAVGEGVPLSLITAREPDTTATVLATRPGGVLDVRMRESSYGPSRAEPWPDALPYPHVDLRRYDGGLLSLGGMRLFSGTTVLPESFRWSHHRPLTHPHLHSVSPGFLRVPRRTHAVALEGEHYYVDCVFDGHFGHLTTEVVCRFWGWDEAKRQIPDLKALVHVRPKPDAGRLERMLLTAYGVAPDDIVIAEQPVRLRTVVGASPMWHNQDPHHAHPDIVDTWHRLTAGLLGDASPGTHERIFVSRGPGLANRRPCRNQAELERFFADRGFHVFYPEDLPMQEQVALFAGARVVAGFGGSAMFNLMHCQHLGSTVVISHNGYVARNEHLFTSLLGADIHYFWQEPEVEPPEHGRTRQSDRSGFSFDFAGQGADLERVLAEA